LIATATYLAKPRFAPLGCDPSATGCVVKFPDFSNAAHFNKTPVPGGAGVLFSELLQSGLRLEKLTDEWRLPFSSGGIEFG